MMKLEVVDNYATVRAVEVDTIDNLKARIMECFFLTEDDLKKRLLVRDCRVKPDTSNGLMPMENGFDLFNLEEGSILKDHFCRDCLDDGDILVLGWTDPFFIRLVSDAYDMMSALDASFKIEVEPYNTLGYLKELIQAVTKKRVTVDNLPTILYNGDNRKPLIFYGFYNYKKMIYADDDDDEIDNDEMVHFYINRKSNNKLVLRSTDYVTRLCIYRTEPAAARYSLEKYDCNEERKKFKLETMDQNGERIVVPRTELYETPMEKMEMNQGMEGDKEDAGPSFQRYKPSEKEMKYIQDIINGTTKQRKKKKIGRKKRIGRFSTMRRLFKVV